MLPYLRDEFRRHRDEKATEQEWATFAAEWQKYLAMISGEGDRAGLVGMGEGSDSLLENMTPEQKIRMQFLEEEARKGA